MKKTSCFWLVLILSQAAAWAGQEALSYNIQAALVTKILAQDRNLAKDAKNGSVVIGILADNKKKSREIAAEFAKLEEKELKINGLSVKYAVVSSTGEALESDLKKNKVNALLLLTENEDLAAKAVKLTQNLKILSMAGENAEKWVTNGVSVGFIVENNKPKILVNISSAVKEERDFSPQFLTLVKIYK